MDRGLDQQQSLFVGRHLALPTVGRADTWSDVDAGRETPLDQLASQALGELLAVGRGEDQKGRQGLFHARKSTLGLAG